MVEKLAVATADGLEAVQTDITVVRGGSGAAQTFTLRSDSVLRIGRGIANDIVLDFNGVSAYHAELFLQQDAQNGATSHTICIRDDSKNGTGVRPGPHAPEVVLKNGALPAWENLVKGGHRALEHGWQLIVPMRSRKGESQQPEIMRMITVYHGSKVGPTTGVDELDGEMWEPAAPVDLEEPAPASAKKGDVGEALVLRKGQVKESEAAVGQDGPVLRAVGALPGVTTPWPRPQSGHYAQAVAPLSAGGQVFGAVPKAAPAAEAALERTSPPIEKVKKKKKDKRAKDREEADDDDGEADESDEEEARKQMKDKKKKKKRKDKKRQEEDEDEEDRKKRQREERERLEREFEDEIALEEKRKQRTLKQKEQEEADRDREDVLAMEREEREFEERRQKQRAERERRLAELKKAREEEEARAAAEAAREAEAANKPATPAVAAAAPSRRSMDGESGDEFTSAWGQALKEALKPLTPASSAVPTPRIISKELPGDITPAVHGHTGDTTPAVHRQGPQTPAGEKVDTAPKSPQPPVARPAAGTPRSAAGTPGAAPGSATGVKAAGTPTVPTAAPQLQPKDTQVEDAQLPSSESLGLAAEIAAEAPEAAKPSEAQEKEDEEQVVPTEAGEAEEDEATPAEAAQPEEVEHEEDEEGDDKESAVEGAAAETDQEAVEAEEAAADAPADDIPPDDAPPPAVASAPSPRAAARTKTHAEVAYEVCECGSRFVQDARFCRACGRKRPPKPEVAPAQAAAPPKPASPKGDEASMPAPPVASRLTAHAIATAVGAPPGVDKDLEPDLRSVSPISTPGIFVAKRKRRRADSLASEDSAPRANKKKARGRMHRKAPSPSRWRPVSPSRFKTVSPSRQRQATVSPSRASLQPSLPRQSFRFRPVSAAARGRAVVRGNEEDTRPKAKRRREVVSPSREARWQPSTTVGRRSPTAVTRADTSQAPSPTPRGVSPMSGSEEPEPVKPAKVRTKKEKRGEKAHKAKGKKDKRGDHAAGKRKDKPKKHKRGAEDG